MTIESYAPPEDSVEARTMLGHLIEEASLIGFTVVDRVDDKPWGAMVQFDHRQADEFIEIFFPGLDPLQARLGNPETRLSPKLLVVRPGHRLSWQYHDRRAERWVFLTDGYYVRGSGDEESEPIYAQAGDEVQFEAHERHRLGGGTDLTVVAEIWQHTDPDHPSDEDDIVRLDDDYSR